MKPLRKLLIGACTVFTLQACTNLGPDYEEPTVEWLQLEAEGRLTRHDPVVIVGMDDLETLFLGDFSASLLPRGRGRFAEDEVSPVTRDGVSLDLGSANHR